MASNSTLPKLPSPSPQILLDLFTFSSPSLSALELGMLLPDATLHLEFELLGGEILVQSTAQNLHYRPQQG